MESISKYIKIKIIPTVVFFALFSLKSVVLGQAALPQINARFSNPQYISEKRMFFLDVELNSKISKEFLFGMNVRFFYDATKLEFRYFDQYSEGYGPLGDPQVLIPGGQGGVQLFSMKGATAFVNGAIQLENNQSQLAIVPNQWVKVFRVCFKLPLLFPNEKDFCPSVFWDIKPHIGNGGYLNGDDGLTINIVEKDPNTPEESAPTGVTGISFNWEQNVTAGIPYGKPLSKNCISMQKLGSREDQDLTYLKDYELFQNEPNPFKHGTVIEFILPSSQKVTLKFYDVSGKVLDEIKGEYQAGRNAVNLESQPWMEGSKVVFYRMETEGFRSKMMKMLIINE